MKDIRHSSKKAYEPPRIMEVLGVSPWILSVSPGNPTPGDDGGDQGDNGGSFAKPNFWDTWDTDDFDDNETSKDASPW